MSDEKLPLEEEFEQCLSGILSSCCYSIPDSDKEECPARWGRYTTPFFKQFLMQCWSILDVGSSVEFGDERPDGIKLSDWKNWDLVSCNVTKNPEVNLYLVRDDKAEANIVFSQHDRAPDVRCYIEYDFLPKSDELVDNDIGYGYAWRYKVDFIQDWACIPDIERLERVIKLARVAAETIAHFYKYTFCAEKENIANKAKELISEVSSMKKDKTGYMPEISYRLMGDQVRFKVSGNVLSCYYPLYQGVIWERAGQPLTASCLYEDLFVGEELLNNSKKEEGKLSKAEELAENTLKQESARTYW